MLRRHLLGLLVTTGAVLVGGPRIVEARQTGSLSAREVLITLRAKDEASAVLADIQRNLADLGDMISREARRAARVYSVNESVHLMSTEVMPFSGYLQPMDYKGLSDELGQALTDMPPLRVVTLGGSRWTVVPTEAPMSTWWAQ